MADIELVIKLPDANGITKHIIERGEWEHNSLFDQILRGALKKAVILPRGHGDLVDISPYKGKVICSHLYSGVKKLIEVDSIKPIIEADKAESEGV